MNVKALYNEIGEKLQKIANIMCIPQKHLWKVKRVRILFCLCGIYTHKALSLYNI